MKYLIIESAIVNNAQANGVTVKDDYNSARMAFHQIRASQLANTNVTYGCAMVVDETMRVYESEYHGSSEPPSNNSTVVVEE